MGSEMCIRDRCQPVVALMSFAIEGHAPARSALPVKQRRINLHNGCLLYTSDAADDLLCVALGGRRIIKKKKITRILVLVVYIPTY